MKKQLHRAPPRTPLKGLGPLRIPLILIFLFIFAYPAFGAEQVEQKSALSELARARLALEAGDEVTALSIYARLAEENPDNADLVLEAARAHHAAGREKEALLLGRRAMEGHQKRRLQVHGAVRASVLYDSNVNQGTDSGSIRLGDFSVHLLSGMGKASAGVYVGGDLDMAYRLTLNGPWWLVGDGHATLRYNVDGDMDDMGISAWHWGRIAAGMRYMDGKNIADLRLKAEVSDYEFDSRVTASGAELRYVRIVSPRLHLISDAGLERRDYNSEGNHALDEERGGTFWRAAGYSRFFFGGAGHEFLIGGGYMNASANMETRGYDGWHVLARFTFKLPRGFALSPQVSFTRESYNGPGTVLETENRADSRLRAGAELTYAINRSCSLQASYFYTNADSVSGIYDYDQHMVSLGAVWTF